MSQCFLSHTSGYHPSGHVSCVQQFLKSTHYSCRNTICEQMQYILNGVKPPHFFPTEHLFERKDSTSQKLCVFCSVVSLVWKGIQSCLFSKWLLFIYTRRLFQKKKLFLKNILLHCCVQSIDS